MDNAQDNYNDDDPHGIGGAIIAGLMGCTWWLCSCISLVIVKLAVDSQNLAEGFNWTARCFVLIGPLATIALWLLGFILARAYAEHKREGNPEWSAAGQ